MASVGHVMVGMVAARAHHHGRVPSWSSMAVWSAVSLLPDADVVGFGLGVAYGDPWGHRGATHSLLFAIGVGLTIGLAARWFKRPFARTALVASVVLASHGLLDTLTDGGLGCALFWPFDLTRYFAPWRPIPVAPIGLYFFSLYGLIVSLTEMVLFAPLLPLALRPSGQSDLSRAAKAREDRPLRRSRFIAAGLVVWLLSVWAVASTDPVHDRMVGLIVREDTAYSSGFSEQAFRSIALGQSDADVRRLLGTPYRETWFYDSTGNGVAESSPKEQHGCWQVQFEAGAVVTLRDVDACRALGVAVGTTSTDAQPRLGAPTETCRQYTWSPSHGMFRLREVCVGKAGVTVIIRQWIAGELIGQ